MATWPANADTDWNTKMLAYLAIEHNTDGTHKDISGDLSIGGFFGVGTPSELTISGGIVTATKSNHRIDTQDDDPSDDLNTINGGGEGDILIISPASSARTIVVKDDAGNLSIATEFSMDNAADHMTLMRRGANWLELSRSKNVP